MIRLARVVVVYRDGFEWTITTDAKAAEKIALAEVARPNVDHAEVFPVVGRTPGFLKRRS